MKVIPATLLWSRPNFNPGPAGLCLIYILNQSLNPRELEVTLGSSAIDLQRMTAALYATPWRMYLSLVTVDTTAKLLIRTSSIFIWYRNHSSSSEGAARFQQLSCRKGEFLIAKTVQISEPALIREYIFTRALF